MVRKYLLLFLISIMVYSCKKEIQIDFYENQIESSDHAEISINYPKAKGDKVVSELINSTIDNYIISQMNLGESVSNANSIDEAVNQFNTEFTTFKTDFPESSQKWEAFFDGEVTYHSPEIISIAINTYLDTGGAHGNTTIRFFNFNPETGKAYTNSDLIKDKEGLSKLIAQRLQEEMKSGSNDSMEDFFFGKDFQLPESLGFSDEGLIVLYNPYEIASYAQGIIEFTMPYENVNPYLSFR